MRLRHAVVLGSRFGGLAAQSWLRRLFSPQQLAITVVDQWQHMVYRPGLVHAMDRLPQELVPDLEMPLASWWRRQHIAMVHDTLVGLDPERREVYTATHSPISYDVLFVATGLSPAWDAVAGLEFSPLGVCEGYAARHTAVLNLHRDTGHFVFAVGSLNTPCDWDPAIRIGCECPIYESALLWDAQLRRRKQRDAARITVITPASVVVESGGPKIRERVQEILDERNIHLIVGARFRRVTRRAIELQDRIVPYDRMVWLPPYTGSRWLIGTGIEKGQGWVPTNMFLQHPGWPEIYAIGDVASHPWPKMGHAAMVQARIAVHHWAWTIRHLSPKPPPYHPQLLWILEYGWGRALFGLSDVLYGGRRQVVLTGRYPYWVKELFGWAYVRRSGALPVMP
jgi:sulfide:quinone oxidoreductase